MGSSRFKKRNFKKLEIQRFEQATTPCPYILHFPSIYSAEPAQQQQQEPLENEATGEEFSYAGADQEGNEVDEAEVGGRLFRIRRTLAFLRLPKRAGEAKGKGGGEGKKRRE